MNEVLLHAPDMAHAKAEVAAVGGRLKLILSDHILVAQFPQDVNVGALAAATHDLPQSLDSLSAMVAQAWLNRHPMPLGGEQVAGPKWQGAGGTPPKDETQRHLRQANRPLPGDVNDCLIGSVAAGIWVVSRSEGSQQFSGDERGRVVSHVIEAVDWMADLEPNANVSFALDWVFVTIDTPPTGHCGDSSEKCEAPWRDAALRAEGYPAGYDGWNAYVDKIIANKETQWGYVAFFTKYNLYHYAYSRYEFRRLVINYGNDGWGPKELRWTFAHETMHLFAADDEYEDSKCHCTDTSGVLSTPNGNCETCNSHHVNCIMLTQNGTMCQYTRGQVGWGRERIQIPMLMVHRGSGNHNIWWSTYNGSAFSFDCEFQQGTTSMRPALAAFNGNVYCAHRGSGSHNIYFRSFDGLLWGATDGEIPHATSSVGPALAAFNGKLYCAHRGSFSDNVYLKYFDGTKWHKWHSDSLPGKTTAASPALCVYNGRLYLAHRGSWSHDLYISSFDGVDWGEDSKIPDATSSVGPSLAVLEGKLYCAHRGSFSDKIYCKVFDGSNWTSMDVPGAHTSTEPGLATWNGVLYLVHRGSWSHNIYYRKYSPSKGWFEDGEVPGKTSSVGPALLSGLPW